VQVRVAVAVEVPPAQTSDLRSCGWQAELCADFDECVRIVPIESNRAAFERDSEVEITVAVDIGKGVGETEAR
jgi:hypothetical protein